jgi:RNA polymerase sigma factor (TIGR02999 family)
VEVVYAELHRIAARQLRGEQTGNTVDTTALIHEAFLRLVDARVDWTDRNHFFAVAARAMRRVLVDHAKSRRRQKRGGGAIAVSLVEELQQRDGNGIDVVGLDEALTRLAAHDERKAQAIELHFFGGLSYEEVATATGVSPATVDRDLRFAKAWLHRELQDKPLGS